ncbi:hypothetical protein ACQ4WX_47020 [Streptomyces lasalocidi]
MPDDSPLDEDQPVAYATRFHLIGMNLRYGRMYLYNWGGTKIPLVLQADGRPPTAAARAVDLLQRRPAGRPDRGLWARAGRRAAEPCTGVRMPSRRTPGGVRRSRPCPTGRDAGTVHITRQPVLITLSPEGRGCPPVVGTDAPCR